MCRTALKKHVAAFKYLYTTCFADRKHCCESGTIYSGPSATFVSAGSRSGTNPIILNIFGNSLEIPYTDCKFTRNNYNQSTRRINQLVNYKNIASKFLFNEINSCMITFFVFCSSKPKAQISKKIVHFFLHMIVLRIQFIF